MIKIFFFSILFMVNLYSCWGSSEAVRLVHSSFDEVRRISSGIHAVVCTDFTVKNELEQAIDETHERGLTLSSERGDPTLNTGLLLCNEKYKIFRGQAPGGKISYLLNSLSRTCQACKEKTTLCMACIPKTIIYMNKDGYGNYEKCNGCPKTCPLDCKNSCDGYAVSEQKRCANYVEAERMGIIKTGKPINFFHSRNNPKVFLHGKNFLDPQEVDSAAIKDPRDSSKKIMGGFSNFVYILKQILDPNAQPVYFHCMGGFHRTGMMGLAVRYTQGGEWTKPFKTPFKVRGKPGKLTEAKDEVVRKIHGGISQIRSTSKSGITISNPAELEYLLHNPEKARAINFDIIRNIFHCVDKAIEGTGCDEDELNHLGIVGDENQESFKNLIKLVETTRRNLAEVKDKDSC